MPFTPELRRKVDQIRDYLYGGGYPDPLSNAEQLSFLFFFYMIEGIDSANLRQAKATGRDYTPLFAGDWTLRNPLNAPAKGVEVVPRERMRWSIWANAMSPSSLHPRHGRDHRQTSAGRRWSARLCRRRLSDAAG
jgi:type I restriction enzyme M protein